MPWKTIGYILIALILILFIAFNLHNTSDVSLIFFTIEAVPVFFTVFISMIIGSLLTIPLSILFRRSPKEKKEKKEKKQEDSLADIQAMLEPSASEAQTEASIPKKSRGRKKRKEKDPSTESISDLDIR